MKFDRLPRVLIIVFVATLPFVNPFVRGDGVGYYAYVRALVVQHNLRFENDWIHSPSPYIGRATNAEGRIGSEYTPTGHLANRYSVGASILWAPFFIPVHAAVSALASVGVNVSADGFSLPYLLACALATAVYGFLGLWISFNFARRYTMEGWTFLATMGIWFASSLPVYMYFNPFYSHASSVFAVAAFLAYWQKTRQDRSVQQWAILGLLAGLMLNVYYLNIALLSFPFLELVSRFVATPRSAAKVRVNLRELVLRKLVFVAAALVGFLPTFITRKIIYGSPWNFGYEASDWTHPVTWQPLFSANHGLLLWTPIIAPALIGLLLLWRDDREVAAGSWASFAVLYYLVAVHPDWHGISSFGNRFFISLTPLFVLGLATFLQEFGRLWQRERSAILVSAAAVFALAVWNLGFMFQWGTGLVPHVGPISFRRMASNQVRVVPVKLATSLETYFTHRVEMMRHLEQKDLRREQEP